MKTVLDEQKEKNIASVVADRGITDLPVLYTWMKRSWQRIAFWVIMITAIFLRLYQFPNTPAGLWVDEATEGYDAFALLQHGIDRWGNHFPIYFPNWGSGQNVSQAYLSIPFIRIFGLNTFSVRLVPVLAGILSVYLLYLTVKKIYGTNTALLAAFLLATLPWGIMASRWGLESNMLPFFFLLSVYILISCYDSPHSRRWIPISLVPLALSLYAYGLAVIPIVGFLALFVLFNLKTILRTKVSVLISFLLFSLISAPFFLFLLENDVLHRALPFLSHLPITIPYLPLNRINEVDGGLSHVAILRSNLEFVISGFHDPYLFNSIPWISPLGWLVPPFAILGIYFSLKRQQLSRNVFVFWLIAALPIFVLIMLNVHHANVLYIPIIALSAYGIVSLLEALQPINIRVVITWLLVGTLFLPNLLFYRYYFTTFNNDNAAAFNAGYDQVLTHALADTHTDEPIYINFSGDWSNYADTLFYLQADAQDFAAHADITLVNGIYQVPHYGRYYFGPAAPPASLNHVSSYVAILKGNVQLSCARTEVLYRNDRWPGDSWIVERCFPKPQRSTEAGRPISGKITSVSEQPGIPKGKFSV